MPKRSYVVVCQREGCGQTASFEITTKDGVEPTLPLARFARDQGTQTALSYGVVDHRQGDWSGKCVHPFGHSGEVREKT